MTYDVIIAGGAVMGSAIAYHLRRLDPEVAVAVVERDPSFEYASTTRSDGNVRIQFNLEENIRISQHAFQVLASFPDEFEVDDFRPDPACRHQGNLFTLDEGSRPAAEAGLRLQRSLGCEVEWLEPDQVAARWPLYAVGEVVGATFGPGDGSVDPAAVLSGYRRKAAALGVVQLTGEVTRVMVKNGSVRGVMLATGEVLTAPVVVNAAGAWAAGLAETAGVDLPVEPVMRTVHVVETDRRSAVTLPSIFLPSGAYVLPESESTYLMAWSQPDDPVGFDFTYSREGFYEVVWPEVVKYLPLFDRLRVVGGWAGLYAVNTLDGNAILGEWPELAGFYLANGFSGHGFQQCHAVGRYLAELILGLPPSLDLSRLGPQRILDDRPLPEHPGRII